MVYSINHLFSDIAMHRKIKHERVHAQTEAFLNAGIQQDVTIPQIPVWGVNNRPEASKQVIASAGAYFWARALEQVASIEQNCIEQ